MRAATDLAEHLVERGTPFREAHARRRLRWCGSRSSGACRSTSSSSTDPRLGPEALALLEPGSAVRRRTTPGGAGPEPVAAQLEAARAPARRSSGLARASTPRDAACRARSTTATRSSVAPELLNKVLVAATGDGRARGAHRRGRGVQRCRRSRQPRVPGPDAAQRDDVRAARPPLRVLLLRHALVRERGVRPGTRRRTRCCCAPAAPLDGHRRDARAARAKARARPRPLLAGPARLGQAFGIDRRRSTAPTSCAGRSASSTTACRRPTSPACRRASASHRGAATSIPWRYFVAGDPNPVEVPGRSGSVRRSWPCPDVSVDEQLRIAAAPARSTHHRGRAARASSRPGRPLRVKLGIDPTASDIHLGFAVVLRKLRQFQDLGHIAVLIIGDFTAQVGDPSGKSATRPAAHDGGGRRPRARPTSSRCGASSTSTRPLEVRRNSEWLGRWTWTTSCASRRSTTVARMLERDDFAKRYRDGVADLADGVPVPAAAGLRLGRDRRPTSSSAAPTSCSTTSWAATSRSRRARSRRSCSRRRCSRASTACKKMSKSLGNYVGHRRAAGRAVRQAHVASPTTLMPAVLPLTTGWHPDRVDEVDRRAGRRVAAAGRGQAPAGPHGRRPVPRRRRR